MKAINFRVKNVSGGTLSALKAVCIVGYNKADRAFTINYADCEVAGKTPAIGLLLQNLEPNEVGIASNSFVALYDTSGDTVGDVYYLSTLGSITKTIGSYTYRVQQVAVVVEVGTSGRLFVLPPKWTPENVMRSGSGMVMGTGSYIDPDGTSGQVVIQRGAGVPAHTARLSCLYHDTNTEAVYVNVDGGATWQQIGGGGSSHNILSATHPDSTAASVARGDLIVGIGATPKWGRLAITAGSKYLKGDGTDVAWGTIAIGDIPTGVELTANKNAASGYAGLSAGSKIALSQITAVLASSDLTNDSALEKVANRGAASGYASLDAGTKVPVAQLGTGTPDGTKFLRDDRTWSAPPGGGGGSEPWEGVLHIAWGDGNPSIDEAYFAFQNTVLSVAGPTPTGIGTAVGRLVAFRFKTAITVATIRWFGIAAVSNAYTVAIYNAATGARVWMLDPINTAAATWGSTTTGLPITLAANTRYWFGIGAKITGTTAGFRTPASPIASSLGITAIPGQLANFGVRYAQVVLTSGAWPATLPALADAAFASAGTTGTLPIFFLEA